MNGNYDFVPAGLAIKAMRDNGYKTTAHAVAELIDNSVQAGAKLVELFAIEEPGFVAQRQRNRVTGLAVLDNGRGMDEATLRIALQFGNGLYLDDRSGIGRFGMGLPASSISQCCRADVWSWQAGPDNALYTYIDLNDIEDGTTTEVPAPVRAPLPDTWRQLSRGLRDSGTLVSWTELDRVNWRGAEATLDNTEFLIGRMYRRLITENGLLIRLAAVREGVVRWEGNARVNDPMYLMAPSATPPPFQDTPMFQPWGETGEQAFTIEVNGEPHEVIVRISYATDATLPEHGGDRGHEPYGKHARRNVGVSLMRAGRELSLDTSWVNNDLRERWWGAEIVFPPELDEVFGVTNNKQAANHFSDLASFYQEDDRAEAEWMQLREEWREENDPSLALIDVANHLQTQLNQIRTALRQQAAGRRGRGLKRHEQPGLEDLATKKFRDRTQSGHEAEEDRTQVDPETKREELTRNLDAKGYSERAAREIAEAVVDRDRKLIFVQQASDSPAFFNPEFLPGVTEVVFNTNHPAYERLVEVLDPDVLDETIPGLRERIQSASDTLKMLLCAWARYEMEEKAGNRRERVADMRREWGKMAKFFLSDDDLSD
ncbi:MAG TPA: ATP-binding protein [Streptosporangiaceae bacterium]|nr:ATP-binding protein [Streptosporangiaceae bacterium]